MKAAALMEFQLGINATASRFLYNDGSGMIRNANYY